MDKCFMRSKKAIAFGTLLAFNVLVVVLILLYGREISDAAGESVKWIVLGEDAVCAVYLIGQAWVDRLLHSVTELAATVKGTPKNGV